MIIHVRDFGKIESADIDLGDLVVFVGENNSGKTYLMQLIYGLFSFFYSMNTDEISEIFNRRKNENKEIFIHHEDRDFYVSFQETINKYIDENKNSIIEKIFHTNNLTIDSLWVEFDALSDDFSVKFEGEFENDRGVFKRYSICKNNKPTQGLGFGESIPWEFIEHIIIRDLTDVLLFELTGLLINHHPDKKSFIYLPASRSGIMLLYANYLSNDKKSNDLENEDIVIERDAENETENEYGLTEPVYDFLMFLLKHKNSEITIERNQSLISFVDKNIINGHLDKVGNAMRYRPDKSDKSIPIFLSSSLVSEIAPIYQILSGIQRYNYIMYDEIETCQHPTKQLQLARLLVRMVNEGFKIIVSTHSDTMAAAINNLITLSFRENKAALAAKLGYEEEDILRPSSVKAYYFEMGENGKTNVVEVPGHFSIGIGFDFKLFNETNNRIYREAKVLVGEE